MKIKYQIKGDTCRILPGISKIGIREANQIKEEYKKLILPSTVVSIGQCAFEYKILLESVQLPKGLKEIGANAFYCCDELKEVIIPDEVTTIGKEAFDSCKKLSKISIGNNVKNIGSGAFASCAISSIKIPNTVTTIKDSTFYGCSNLTSVDIPCSIKAIKAGAFSKTNIKDLYLSADSYHYEALVKAFDNGAFRGRGPGAIERSKFYANVFNDPSFLVYYGITLHVPKGTERDYQNHHFFGKFQIVTR